MPDILIKDNSESTKINSIEEALTQFNYNQGSQFPENKYFPLSCFDLELKKSKIAIMEIDNECLNWVQQKFGLTYLK